jgi:hypothetical protein
MVRIYATIAGVTLFSCFLSACPKGYNVSEALYNASQTQNQLNSTPAERGGKQDMNYQQYETERKRQP